MKVIAITEENLEDLLAYDDLFLDYFNAFSSLPVFPQALVYNRLTGSFEEISSPYQTVSVTEDVPDSPPYGATDAEREAMLQWAKDHRLPLFLNTELFREFKLCKLLLRPLDDRYSACNRSSHLLRGYSRQTESYVSSLSNSADNSANYMTDEAFDITSWSGASPDKEDRLTGRAKSLPVGDQYGIKDRQEDKSRVTADPGGGIPKSDLPLAPKQKKSAVTRFSEKVETIPDNESLNGRYNTGLLKNNSLAVSLNISNGDEAYIETLQKQEKSKHKERASTPYTEQPCHVAFYARAVSAPSNYEEYVRLPAYRDFDAMFGEPEPVDDGTHYVLFEDDEHTENQTDADVKSMEGRHNMTYQQLKEYILSTSAGMDLFMEFLSSTAGNHLLHFWLDCENFKDSMEDFDDVTNMEIRNRLYRDIQDKYRMTLTEDAKTQISKSASRPNVSLSHTIFIRTQYDVLRRLRTYWLPRFIIHLEHTDYLMLLSDAEDDIKALPNQHRPTSVFPSLSLAKSLPVNPDDVLALTKYNSWENICKTGVTDHRKLQSAGQNRVLVMTSSQPFKERLLLALTSDKAAGGPFRRFLETQPDRELVCSLCFWQDVSDYGLAEDRSADRLLRLAQAMTIYTKYVSMDSPFSIGLDTMDVVQISHKLNISSDFIEASIFNPAKVFVIRFLQDHWIRFLKEELKTFLDCRVRDDESGSLPSTAEVIDISVTEDNQLVITRPRPWIRKHPSSSPSERGQRLRRALSIADTIEREKFLDRKKKAKERRKEMEKERKKAVRAAKQRQNAAKTGISATQTLQKELPETDDIYTELPDDIPGRPLTFADVSLHRQLMQVFRKYLQDTNQRDIVHLTQLHHDIHSYKSVSGKESINKKDTQANYIYKTYLDSQARKAMNFPEKIQGHINHDKERPKSATLGEMFSHAETKLEDIFFQFLQHEAEVLNSEVSVLQTMSLAELGMKLEQDSSLGAARKKRTKHGKATARSQPNKDDKVEFMLVLNQSAAGHMPLRLFYFYKYLYQHGEAENVPLAHNDLVFYIEVMKFKEYSHSHSDEEMLKRKVQSINDCFLESHTPPSLQVTLSTDIHSKTVRAAQKYTGGKEISSMIFDEAQFAVFKELLPFWSGFKKSYSTPKSKLKPLTKIQKLIRKRLDNIENYTIPKPMVTLPPIPHSTVAAVSLSFSLNDGIKLKETEVERTGTRMDSRRMSVDPRRMSIDPSKKKRLLTVDSVSSHMGERSRRRASLLVK